MKTIMYIAMFFVIASVPNLYRVKNFDNLIQHTPKTKVDSVIHIATIYEKKIDSDIMTKISINNSKIDSLERVIKIKDNKIRKYKKLLNKK